MKTGVTGRELDQLSRFAASLGSTLDETLLIEDAVEPLSTMAKSSRIAVAIAQSDARHLVIRYDKNDLLSVSKDIPAPPIAALGTETVVFETSSQLPSQLGNRLSDVGGTIAIVPLWAHAHLRGVIILQKEDGVFSLHMQKMLTTAGRQLALAVENSRLLGDLQESYRKLMDTQEDLIRAERLAALGQLSATMAHEIRNPLTTIFSALSQIRKHASHSEMSETLLDIAEEEASRLKRMVAELLKFARPQKPILQKGNLLHVVQKIVEEFSLTMGKTDSPVEVLLSDSSESAIVEFDREHLSRAMQLLIHNAVESYEEMDLERASNQQIVEVRVSKRQRGAVISISDKGNGIPVELMQKVFEPFFSTKPTGTGLGLSGAQRIAEDHGGGLKIDSNAGIGTTVELFIQTRQLYAP